MLTRAPKRFRRHPRRRSTETARWKGRAPCEASRPPAPGTLYAVGFAKIGFLGGGLFRSTDGGRHWTDTRTDGIVAFAVAPSDANTAYRTATFFDGPGGPEPAVERTADGGFTWGRVSGLIGGVELTAVAVDPTDPTIAYAAVQNQVYPSTDAFTRSHGTPVSVRSLLSALVSPGGPHALYAGGPGALAESLDGGVTWTVLASLPVRPTESVDHLLADYAHPGTLYAVLNTDVPPGQPMPCPPTRSRIARTTDGGTTWAARSVFLDPRGTLAAGAGGGLYLFRVGGR